MNTRTFPASVVSMFLLGCGGQSPGTMDAAVDARSDAADAGSDVVPAGPVCEAAPGAHCWYVDPVRGSDTAGDGSIDHPFFRPQTAVILARPGDYVYLRGGTYDMPHAYPYVTTDYNDPASQIVYAIVNVGSDGLPSWALTRTGVSHYVVQPGTADALITLEGYPGERAVLHGDVRVARPYWRVQGLVLDGQSMPSTAAVIALEGDFNDAAPTHDVWITDNEVENLASWVGNNPGLIRINRGARADNVHIERNRIHGFRGCTDSTCTALETNTDHKVGAVTTLSNQDYDGFDAPGTLRIEIRDNVIYDTTNAFFFKNPMAGPIVITGNVIHDEDNLGFCAASNVTMSENLVYNVPGGFGGLGANAAYTDARMFTIAGNNLTLDHNTFVGMQELLTMQSTGTGHSITHNVIFGLDQRVGGANPNCCSDSSAYIKRNGADPLDVTQSTLQTVTSDQNCFITPAPLDDIEFVMRILQSTPPLEHYTQAQARDTFHFDANSVFLGASDPAVVFANPAAADYHLAPGSAAATQCAMMGY